MRAGICLVQSMSMKLRLLVLVGAEHIRRGVDGVDNVHLSPGLCDRLVIQPPHVHIGPGDLLALGVTFLKDYMI